MRVLADRSARSMLLTSMVALAATLGVAGPASLVAAAGSSKPLARPSGATLQQVSDLIGANKLVEAKSLAESLLAGDSLSMSDRGAASALLQVINGRLAEANPLDVSLQKAELALTQDDLRAAERQARSIADTADASAEMKARAGSVLERVTARRAVVAPEAAAALAEAQSAFDAGRYGDARSAVEKLNRWGVSMSEADQARLDALQLKIAEMGTISGGAVVQSSPAGDTTGLNGVRLVKDEMGVVPTESRVEGTGTLPAGQAPAPFFPFEGTTPAQPAMAEAAPAPVPAPVEIASAPAVSVASEPAPVSGDNLLMLALRAEAQRSLLLADQMFDSGRFPDAARQYEAVLASQRQYLDSGEIARAESRLAQARVRMQSATGGTLEQTVLQNSAIVREKAQAEFDNAVSQAESSLAAGDTDKASAFASSGQLSLDRAKSFFSQSEADSMNSRLRDLQRRIEARRDELAVTRRKDAETAAAAEATKAKERLRNDRERKVSEGIERVRALQREQKYDEALEVTNQVLFIDPNNPSALLLRDIIGDIIVMKQAQTQGRRMQSNMRTFRMQGQEAMIPPTELVEYPTDWPRLTQMRTGAGGYYESPANRSAMATLQGKIVPVQFNRVPLENALAYLAKNTGVDIDADWASLKQLGVGPETPITIDRINDQPAKVVLEDIIGRITRDPFARADYAIRDGVVRIGSADVIRQQTVVEHYPITDLLQVAPDYADVPETDLYKITRNRQMRGAGLAGTADPFQRKAEAGKPGASDRREKIRQVVGVIQNTVDANSWRDNGGDVGSIMELNGVLVITTSPRNHREITGLLSRLREIRQTQINVETRFLLVNQDFFEQISFDLDLYFNTNSNQVTEARALDPNIRPSDFFAFPGNQFLRRTLDGGAYAASADNTTPTTIPFIRDGQGGTPPPGGATQGQNQVQPSVLPANWSPIGAGNGSAALARTLTPTNNNFVSNLLAANPALGIAGQYLDDIQVDFVIRATQADRRTITLNAPRLTFTNGQIANVVVGSQRGYISDLEVVTGDGSVGFDPDPDTVSDGVTLLIEGVTSADRRYVTLNVEAGVSTVQELANFPTTAATDGVLVTGNVQLPLLSVSRVNTTVTVPDQGTILLGGQRLTSELEIETGVPVLSKIPIINRFFTNRVEAKQDSTLLILLKPTVLVQSEQEEKFFPGLNDALRGGN